MGLARVLARVRQRFLHDPIGGQVGAERYGPGHALDAQLDWQASESRLLDQGLEVVEPRLGGEPEFLTVAAEHAEQARHLGECLPPGLLDGADRLQGELGCLSQDFLGGARLDDHDADGVRDHVVQFACDPSPLLPRGLTCALLALTLRLLRTEREHVDVLDAAAHRLADQPRGEQEHGDEAEVGAAVGLTVVRRKRDLRIRGADRVAESDERPARRCVERERVQADKDAEDG